MKTCPKCHQSHNEAVLTCDCGYEFPSLKRIRLAQPFGFPKGCVGCVVVCFSIVGVFLSFFVCILPEIWKNILWKEVYCDPTYQPPPAISFV
jgi:hypothetical protein